MKQPKIRADGYTIELESYAWDGYTTWYGTEFTDQKPREISPEEIEEAVERYSSD